MTARVAWTGGGEATVLALDDAGIVVRSTVPSPPGSRIAGTVEGAGTAMLRLKVHACRRLEGGAFELRGRPIDLTRELRLHVVSLVGD